MKEIKNSYFNYLYNLGLSDLPFNYSYKEVYEELLTLDLSNEVLIKKLINKLNSRMILNSQIGIRKQDIRNHFIVSNILFHKFNSNFGDYKLYTLNYNAPKKFIFGKSQKPRNDSYDEFIDIILIGKSENEKKEYGIPKHAVQIENTDNIDQEERNALIKLMNNEPEFIDYRVKTSKTAKQLEKIRRKLSLRKKYVGDQI